MLKPHLIRQATDWGGRTDGHAVGSGVNVSVDDGVAGGNMQIICAFCVQLPH